MTVAAIMSFSSKRKERVRPRFLPDALQRGAISWQVVLDDSGQSALVDCYLGISTDTLVLIEERSREIVFVMPCKAVLGWSTQTNRYCVICIEGVSFFANDEFFALANAPNSFTALTSFMTCLFFHCYFPKFPFLSSFVRFVLYIVFQGEVVFKFT
jgi:hypothetical protein